MNRTVWKYLHSLMSQFREDDVTKILPMVEIYINNSRIPSRGNFTPNEIFMGRRIKKPSLIDGLKDDKTKRILEALSKKRSLDVGQLKFDMEKTAKELDFIGRKCSAEAKASQQKARNIAVQKFNPQNIQFGIGDYVLISRKGNSTAQNKTRLIWSDPFVVSDIIGHNVYKVRSIDGKEKIVHAIRMLFYDGNTFQFSQEVRDVFLFNNAGYEIFKIIGCVEQAGKFLVKVHWKGFEENESSWEPAERIFEDVPVFLKSQLQNLITSGRNQHAKNLFQQLFDEAHAKSLVIQYPNTLSMRSDATKKHLTRSPGWSDKELLVLKQLIVTFGLGSWSSMLKTGYLPGKTKAQIVSCVQRIILSARLAEFASLKIDLDILRRVNLDRKEKGTFNYKDLCTQWNKNMHQLKPFEEPLEEQSILTLFPQDLKNNQLNLQDKLNIFLKAKDPVQSSLKNVQWDAKTLRSDGYKKNYFDFRIKVGNDWRPVPALLDSGATITCGSHSMSSLQGLDLIDISSKQRVVFDANGKPAPITHVVRTSIMVRLKGNVLNQQETLIVPSVDILLVNSPAWDQILLGRDVLKPLGLDPNSLLEERLKQPRDEVLKISLTETHVQDKKFAMLLKDILSDSQCLVKRISFLDELHTQMALIRTEFQSKEHWDGNLFNRMFKIPLLNSMFQIQNVAPNHYLFQDENDPEMAFKLFIAPPRCVPIHADITQATPQSLGLKAFECLIADPPWEMNTSTTPTRGLTISYSQLPEIALFNIDLSAWCSGLTFIWTIPSKISFTNAWLQQYKFKIVEEIVWVKLSSKGNIIHSQGKFAQRGKEFCLVGQSDNANPMRILPGKLKDVMLCERSEQSQKPELLKEMIQNMCPSGTYGEIFGRKNNLRNFWTTVGLEL